MTHSARLSICGDVERPAHLALPELRSLTDAEVVADFHCREGWSRLGERWRGVSKDRIEVTRHPQQATAATIALARLEH